MPRDKRENELREILPEGSEVDFLLYKCGNEVQRAGVSYLKPHSACLTGVGVQGC